MGKDNNEKGTKAGKLAAAASKGSRKGKGEEKPTPAANAPQNANGKGKKGGKKRKRSREVKPEATKRDFGKPSGKPGEERKINKAGIKAETRVNNGENGTFGRVLIFGFPLAQVLRTLRHKGFTPSEVRKAFDACGLNAVRINTIRDKMSTRDAEKKHAPLGKKELATLRTLADA